MALRQDSADGVELTEKLVLTRTRAPDLDSVKKLNCWASNICDVSVVRRMPNLEVCSLSINRITTLRDFAHCHKLKELYVRTNKIECLGDVHYLKNLPKLRSLWLSENPCADAANYRLTVLRTLPNLQKLDNTAVTQDEVQEALSSVDEVPFPNDFSNSSVFHPILTDSSVSSMSNVSSIEPLLHRDSATCVSVSVESLPAARKKREQRRLKKAEEELTRLNKESSARTKSKEGKSDEDNSDSLIVTSDSSSSQEVCGGDDLKKSTESEAGENSNGAVEKIEDKKDKKSSPVINEDGNDDNKGDTKNSSLADHISDDSNVSESCDSSIVDESETAKDDIEEEVVMKEKKDDGSKDAANDTNNNSAKKSDLVAKPDMNCNSVEGELFIVENVIGDSDITHQIITTDNSMLDRIRLNDSLAIEESQEVQESIELDDLVVEFDGERPNPLTPKYSKNVIHSQPNRESRVSDFKVSSTPSSESFDDKVSASVNCISTQSHAKSTPSVSSPPKAIGQARNKEQEDRDAPRMSKVESVDWEQYNRMRQDLGMRPMERVSTSRPSSSEVARVRNANILQAVLSLVKELDKDSLDLVMSAVTSRRESL